MNCEDSWSLLALLAQLVERGAYIMFDIQRTITSLYAYAKVMGSKPLQSNFQIYEIKVQYMI